MHGLHGYSTVNNVTRPTVKHRCKKNIFHVSYYFNKNAFLTPFIF